MAMQNRRQVREMRHRERLAMIDRGLVPPPEVDPGAFDANFARPNLPESRATVRWRSAGVMMIGMGLAFMFLISFAAGEAGVGIGVGGAFALIGAAFFVNATLLNKSESRHVVRPPSYVPRRTDVREPPPNPPSAPPES
jgi:hypothetical protein